MNVKCGRFNENFKFEFSKALMKSKKVLRAKINTILRTNGV